MTSKGEEFVVMEYIRGTGLILLAEMRSPELIGRELDFLLQSGEALAYVHEQGIIHRDVCPHNVIITPERVAKLIDFGLSIPNTPNFCKPGNRTGKVSYMAPELIKRSTTDVRVDVFAFGVSAYQVLTGNLPWESSQSLESMLQHINHPPRDPRKYRPDLSDEIAAVLLKAIERDRNARFENMQQLNAALRELRDREA
jgi:serine/threonine protein kinase